MVRRTFGRNGQRQGERDQRREEGDGEEAHHDEKWFCGEESGVEEMWMWGKKIARSVARIL